MIMMGESVCVINGLNTSFSNDRQVIFWYIFFPGKHQIFSAVIGKFNKVLISQLAQNQLYDAIILVA